MSTENDDHDGGEWDDPSDLTRLEDLSEFLHEEDPEVEAKLKAAQDSEEALPDLPDSGEDLMGLGDLEDDDQAQDTSEDTFKEESNFEDDGASFSEEATNPAFETPDLPESPDDSLEGPSNDSESDSSDSDWQDSSDFSSSELSSVEGDDNNFESSDSDSSYEDQDFQSDSSFEENDFSSDDTDFSAGESSDDSGEASWEEESNFDSEGEQSFDDHDDENPGAENQDDDDQETQDFSDGSSFLDESEDDTNQNYQGKQSYLGDDAQDDSSEAAGFELPDPQELNERPPIEAATDHGANQVAAAPRENFQDLRDFGNAITYGVVTTGGNPPFSLILRNVKFEEDAEDIKILLREHGLVSDENEETITQGLQQGSLLISQISEYSAIFLAHKLRRFDVEIRIGLSDQLHPSKSYTREGRGLVSKYNLRQNHRESLADFNTDIEVEDIKMSTTPTLDGYNIHRYVDVITSHTLIEEDELKRLHDINESNSTEHEEGDQDLILGELLEQFPTKDHENVPTEQFDLGLNEIYKELVVELRNEAYKIEANAVVGINFNITPLMIRSGNNTNVNYKITCSGNAVWVVDQQV